MKKELKESETVPLDLISEGRRVRLCWCVWVSSNMRLTQTDDFCSLFQDSKFTLKFL